MYSRDLNLTVETYLVVHGKVFFVTSKVGNPKLARHSSIFLVADVLQRLVYNLFGL